MAMAAVKKGPQDDEVYRHEAMINWWTGPEMRGKHMGEDFIHRYFSESPFFDWTSKNGLLIDQSKSNLELFNMTLNRQAFEDQLRGRAGLEFMIVDTPQPVSDKDLAAQDITTGIYVIRKQERQRVPDMPYVRPPYVLVERGPDGRDAWELTILATYFIVGENVFQAPSVFDLISNRVLNSSWSLNKFCDVAGSLPRYTPGTGFHYLPRVQKPTTSLSVPGTPSRSREGSIAPGADDQSLRSGSVQPESQAGGASTSGNFKNIRLLNQSLLDAVQFADDYIDENPLMGEPGNFRFSASTAAIKKRRADEEAAAAAKAKAEKESATTSRVAIPKADKAPTPPAVFSEAKATTKEKGNKEERRGSKKADKAQRRKSRGIASGTATSPTTPGSATSTQAPNSAL